MSVGIKFYYTNNNDHIRKLDMVKTYNKYDLKNKNILNSNWNSNYNDSYKFKIYKGYRVKFYNIDDATGSFFTIRAGHYFSDIIKSVTDLGSYKNFKSIIIEKVDGPVIIYKDSNYSNPIHFKEGGYNTAYLEYIGLLTSTNNNFYSCKIIPGYKLIIYTGTNYSGSSQIISNNHEPEQSESIAAYTIYYVFNNTFRYNIKSIKIEKIPESFTTENFTQNSNNNMIYYILFVLFIYYIMTRKK